MSSSAIPSAAPPAEYAEHSSNLVAIPSLSHENHYFLGPVGSLDPTEFINGETNRIPFRLANPDLGHWKNTFKSWPSLEKTSPEKSWITWFKRISASKRVHWDANPMSLNTKNQYDFKTKSIGVMKFVNRPSVTQAEFPRLEPIEDSDGEERTHRRCTSFGEYASTPTDAGAKLSAEMLKDWFCSFYEGFQKEARVWFLYEDSTLLEHPLDFRFEDINHDRY
uniref:Aminotransferase-like n=1 Tax=Oryza sativa subsp. japonica TaxID=39947 RepID=Q6EQI3_ORYSJ|nr:aminotransferase-like [Oryza sativa Japonica Group]BAD29087.1 aminotransferase-like [Oryza sativa Japonica Group]